VVAAAVVAAATGETVTSAGKTVNKDGVTITIPAGAVADEIKVKIEKAATALNLPLPAKAKLVSEIFEITNDKAGDFTKPVTITLAFNQSGANPEKHRVSIYWFDESIRK